MPACPTAHSGHRPACARCKGWTCRMPFLGLARPPELRSSMAEAEQANVQLDISKAGYQPRLGATAGPDNTPNGEPGDHLTASQRLYV